MRSTAQFANAAGQSSETSLRLQGACRAGGGSMTKIKVLTLGLLLAALAFGTPALAGQDGGTSCQSAASTQCFARGPQLAEANMVCRDCWAVPCPAGNSPGNICSNCVVVDCSKPMTPVSKSQGAPVTRKKSKF